MKTLQRGRQFIYFSPVPSGKFGTAISSASPECQEMEKVREISRLEKTLTVNCMRDHQQTQAV